MLIFFKENISIDQVDKIRNFISDFKFIDFNFDKKLRGVYLLSNQITKRYIAERFTGIEKIVEIDAQYKFVSRQFKDQDTIIDVGGFKIGNGHFQKIGGPCSFENEETFRKIASSLKGFGVNIIRGGAFKPRTSPYFFQGIGEEALRSMRTIADELDVKIVSEIMSIEHIDLFNEYSDIIQVGARNMQNYDLLKRLGKLKKPILLKRGMSATLEELLLSAEYIVSNGNMNVILCERGIRTFEESTRNTLDISVVPLVKSISHLPIIIDPSHASGRRDLIFPLALAGVSAGCDGIMVEVHDNPDEALSDGNQSIKPEHFKEISDKIDEIRKVLF